MEWGSPTWSSYLPIYIESYKKKVLPIVQLQSVIFFLGYSTIIDLRCVIKKESVQNFKAF